MNRPFSVWMVTILSLFMAALIITILMLLAPPARAHDAMPTAAQPDGWTYPYSCCSGLDCRPVPESAISEGPDGFVIRATGEMISYGDTRVKQSPDGIFHWCSVAGAPDSRTICLFVPPRGM